MKQAAPRAPPAAGVKNSCAPPPLSGGQGLVVPSEESVEGRVPGDHRTQEGRRRAEYGLIVHQDRHVIRGVGLSGLCREGIPEQFHERRDLQDLRRLKIQHAVSIQEQERQVLPRRVIERVERARRGRQFACKAAEKETVVERETDHVHRLASHAVQLVEPASRDQGGRARRVVEGGRGVDQFLAVHQVHVTQCRERIDERVAGENRRGALPGQNRLGPAAGEEVAFFVGVASALAAHIEVEHLTGLAGRFADMATATRSGLHRGIDNRLDIGIGGVHRSAEGRPRGQVDRLALIDVDPRGPDRVVKEQLAEVAFRLGRLIPIGHGPIRLRRHRDSGIGRGNGQVIEAPNLSADKVPQLGGRVLT